MYWRNKDGAALPIVIILFVVLMVFGTAVVMIWTFEARTATIQEQRIKAQYAARSDAEAVAKFIVKPENFEEDLVLEIAGLSEGEELILTSKANSPMTKSTMDIKITKRSDKIEVYAAGHIGDVKGDAKIIIGGEYKDLHLIFDKVIHAKELDTSGYSVILGDISYENTLSDSKTGAEITDVGAALDPNGDGIPDDSILNVFNPLDNGEDLDITAYDWDPAPVIEQVTMGFVEPSLPEIDEVHTLIKYESETKMNLYDKDLIKELKGVNAANSIITFEEDTVLVVDSCEILAGFDISSDVTVTIYVLPGGDLTVKTPQVESHSPEQLIIMGMENSTITITANSGFHGFVYAPSATVNVKTSGDSFYGAIIADNFNDTNAAGAEIVFSEFPDDLGAAIGSEIEYYYIDYWEN